ncbi:MAG: hypothetical protein KAX38_07280 [Candidatus Krumholzibacteria bacterium]|nr:hypothetical protein [Candidatus Krumholzibacteria bacterium]
MTRRVVLGMILTVGLLGLSGRLSTNKPQDISVGGVGLRLSHRTVYEQVGPGEPVLRLSVESTVAVQPWLVTRMPGGEVLEALMNDAGNGVWEMALPDLGKGKRLEYAFVVEGTGGESVRLPSQGGRFLVVKYKGDYSIVVLVLHIIFMFGAFFFMIQSFMGALWILMGAEGKSHTVGMMRWVMIFTFIGGWPLGFILNYQRFGPVWEGFPFGFDITDNKTQIMFLFWVVTVFLVGGSFFGRGEKFDRIGPRGFAWAVIISFIVSLSLYILPHSL